MENFYSLEFNHEVSTTIANLNITAHDLETLIVAAFTSRGLKENV